MNPPLLDLCASLLAVPSTPAPLRRVAGRALLTAIEEDCVLPVEALRVTWDWLLHEPGFFHGAELFALLDDEHVRATAVASLEGSAVDRHRLALVEMVLAGAGHAHHLDDATVWRLAEQAVAGWRADAVAGVVAGVHAARGLPAPLLREVRDRWAMGNAAVREAALSIALLEDEIDPAFVEQLLGDPSAQVRLAVADTLRRNPLFDRRGELAYEHATRLLASLRERVRLEPAREVQSALETAISAMADAFDAATRGEYADSAEDLF